MNNSLVRVMRLAEELTAHQVDAIHNAYKMVLNHQHKKLSDCVLETQRSALDADRELANDITNKKRNEIATRANKLRDKRNAYAEAACVIVDTPHFIRVPSDADKSKLTKEIFHKLRLFAAELRDEITTELKTKAAKAAKKPASPKLRIRAAAKKSPRNK